jgi:hypothetical protein
MGVSKKCKGKTPAGYKNDKSNPKGSSMRKSTAVLIVYIPCYHLQLVASRIHVLPILHWLEIGTRMDPMDSHRNSLQKSCRLLFVKNKIILDIPHFPYNGTISHSYLHNLFFGISFNQLPKRLVTFLVEQD